MESSDDRLRGHPVLSALATMSKGGGREATTGNTCAFRRLHEGDF